MVSGASPGWWMPGAGLHGGRSEAPATSSPRRRPSASRSPRRNSRRVTVLYERGLDDSTRWNCAATANWSSGSMKCSSPTLGQTLERPDRRRHWRLIRVRACRAKAGLRTDPLRLRLPALAAGKPSSSVPLEIPSRDCFAERADFAGHQFLDSETTGKRHAVRPLTPAARRCHGCIIVPSGRHSGVPIHWLNTSLRPAIRCGPDQPNRQPFNLLTARRIRTPIRVRSRSETLAWPPATSSGGRPGLPPVMAAGRHEVVCRRRSRRCSHPRASTGLRTP